MPPDLSHLPDPLGNDSPSLRSQNWSWFASRFPGMLTILAAAGLGLAGTSVQDGKFTDVIQTWQSMVIGGCLLAVLVAEAITWKRQPDIRALQDNARRWSDAHQSVLRSQGETFDRCLHGIAESLGFDHHVRVSAYKCLPTSRALAIVGRYSRHQEYAKRTQLTYPDDMGAIGEARETGGAVSWSGPAYDPDHAAGWIDAHCARWPGFNANRKAWLREHVRMRSCRIEAIPIRDSDDFTTIGVVLVEADALDSLPPAAGADGSITDELSTIRTEIESQAAFLAHLFECQKIDEKVQPAPEHELLLKVGTRRGGGTRG